MPYSDTYKARILVEADLTTDRQAAQSHDVSRSSISRWRKAAKEDPDMQELMAERWEEMRRSDSWVQDATHTIRSAQGFLRDATDELDPSDPEAVKAVENALGTLIEGLQMARVVDARLGAPQRGSHDETGGQGGPRPLPNSDGGAG